MTPCGAVRGIPGQDSVSASHCYCDLSSRPQFPVLKNGHSNSTSQTLRTWQSHLLCIDCCCWSYYYSERSQSISIKNDFFGFIFSEQPVMQIVNSFAFQLRLREVKQLARSCTARSCQRQDLNLGPSLLPEFPAASQRGVSASRAAGGRPG